MLDYDPVLNLQHYPVGNGMKRFGLTPHGDALYRIVFGPSRRYLVVGEWPDGSRCAQWVPLYRHLGPIWIMERWEPAEAFAKCSREEWDREYLILGPWPERGDYRICHPFDVAPPSDASLSELITLIERGMNTSFGDTLRFNRQSAVKERQAVRATAEDMIRNRLPAYGSAPFVGGRGHRGSKTAPIIRTAEELGLPTRAGMAVNGARKKNPVTRMIESAA